MEEDVLSKLDLQLSYFRVIGTTYGRDQSKLLQRDMNGALHVLIQKKNVHQGIHSKAC